MSGDFLQILTEAISPRNAKGKREKSPLNNIIGNMLIEALSPNSQPNRQRKQNGKSPTQSSKMEGSDVAGLAVALGLKLAGETLKHLRQERIPGSYRGDTHLALPEGQTSQRSSPSASNKSTCGVCEEVLSSEATTHLNCGHLFHTKCLYCCHLYLQVEDEGTLTCPIKKCGVEIKGKLLESILDTKI